MQFCFVTTINCSSMHVVQVHETSFTQKKVFRHKMLFDIVCCILVSATLFRKRFLHVKTYHIICIHTTVFEVLFPCQVVTIYNNFYLNSLSLSLSLSLLSSCFYLIYLGFNPSEKKNFLTTD